MEGRSEGVMEGRSRGGVSPPGVKPNKKMIVLGFVPQPNLQIAIL